MEVREWGGLPGIYQEVFGPCALLVGRESVFRKPLTYLSLSCPCPSHVASPSGSAISAIVGFVKPTCAPRLPRPSARPPPPRKSSHFPAARWTPSAPRASPDRCRRAACPAAPPARPCAGARAP